MAGGRWGTRMRAAGLGATIALFLFECLRAAADVAPLLRNYGLKVETRGLAFPVRSGGGLIDGADARPEDVESYVRILQDEWYRYPVALVRRTGLKRIVICKDLSFARQLRAAVPDFEHDTLYLDALRGRGSETYVRSVIHHEFYHIIDLRDDGKLYQDGEWASLNAPGFSYGTGGTNAQGDHSMALRTDSLPGFLDKYATTGVEEDKAETFACMMTDLTGVQRRADEDMVLAAKVGLMKRLLARFCPQAAGAFWRHITPPAPSPAAPPSNSVSAIGARFARNPCFADVWWRK